MDESRFKALLQRLQGIWDTNSRYFTSKDLETLTRSQLNKLTLTMLHRCGIGPGSYFLPPEFFYLIDYLDKNASIPEDQHLERALHLTASLLCLTHFQGCPFSSILPSELHTCARHLESIIGPPRDTVHSDEWDPCVQIATFLAYPVLEGVIRRKLCEYISPDGRVLCEFHVSGREKPYEKDRRISSLEHELQLLEQKTTNLSLKSILSDLRSWQPFNQVYYWRNKLLHGELTLNWHSISILLITYLILLNNDEMFEG